MSAVYNKIVGYAKYRERYRGKIKAKGSQRYRIFFHTEASYLFDAFFFF